MLAIRASSFLCALRTWWVCSPKCVSVGNHPHQEYVHLRSFVVFAVHGEGSSGELLGIESVGADLRSVLA